uniref:Uncharacterized protein n=1 Tax=Tanacetum cinerariifolium TaxID=118510 RepID=A0A699JIE8_TANCI|nr:hypothetical protein [Tanacetum cinerariifolium]
MAARDDRNNLVARRRGDYEEVFDLVMELKDDMRNEPDNVAVFNRLIAVAEEKIHGKEIDLEMLEAEGNNG